MRAFLGTFALLFGRCGEWVGCRSQVGAFSPRGKENSLISAGRTSGGDFADPEGKVFDGRWGSRLFLAGREKTPDVGIHLEV